MAELPIVSVKVSDGRTNGAPALHLAAALRRHDVDPFGAVFELGRSFSRGAMIALLAAAALHAGAALHAVLGPEDLSGWSRWVSARVHERLALEVDIVEAKEPEPEPPPPPEETKDETPPPPPVVAPPPPAAAAPKEAPPPAPAAAQAGSVITSDPSPDEPVDLTNTFVTGNADTYAGGTTQRGGTSDKAVYNSAARADGVPGGKGTAPAAPTVDRSRSPVCDNSGQDWTNCPFPPEADTAQIDEAKVSLRVTVGLTGSIEKVDVLNDPGYGFGREAKRCALRQRCSPGLDRSGAPAAGMTKNINVTFSR